MEQTQHNASCTALRALRGDEMVEPDEVAQMLRLKALGWGTRRIAVELGVNRGTVKRYIKSGGWTPYVQPKRRCLLDGHEVWLKERFKRHAGNADVVRQELTTELGVTVSLRTLQRALQPFRQELRAEARATVRFETLPGRQMQIDFAKHWRFTPRACAPYRARTKGKTENGVGYVKKNAIAGRSFASFEELEAHLVQWTREIADVRTHGTTGEAPKLRFEQDERMALKPINGVPPFQAMREVTRKVQADCRVEIDSNSYSVPWRLIGETVQIIVADGVVRIVHAGKEVARHGLLSGKRQHAIDPVHFEGVAGANGRPMLASRSCGPPAPNGGSAGPQLLRPSELLRPLSEYEAIAGGGW